MRSIFVFLLCLIAFPILVGAEESNFQDFPWDSNPLTILKKSEGLPKTDHGYFSYPLELNGLPFEKRYYFSDQKLHQIVIINVDLPEDLIEFIYLYESVLENLNGHYGEPLMRSEIWYENTYEGISSMKGEAVKLGHLALGTQWAVSDTYIELVLRKEGKTPQFSLQFEKMSPELFKLVTDINKKLTEDAKNSPKTNKDR